jgi:hypothetical protein
MPPPRLHLDADTSMKALCTALVTRGHDVTRTPNAWMARDPSDTEQLLGATAQGRVLFTFNTHDFPVLVQQYPQHDGLVLAAQQSWSVSQLIAALDCLLTETEAADWPGEGRWLNQWRRAPATAGGHSQ